MQAGAKPSHADLHAFAGQLAEVRALDTKGEYKEQLDKLKATYQFVLLQSLDRVHKEMLRAQIPDKLHLIKKQLYELEAAYQFVLRQSLDRFHKEMFRAQLPDKLHLIKEKLCDTDKPLEYVTNLPFSSWNLDIKRCRDCLTDTLKLRQFSSELCCETCGLLEPLDGVSFDDNEMYQYTDYKAAKQRRPKNRCYNFKYYLDKHVRLLARKNYTVSDETVQKAKEAFNAVEAAMPKRISMPFVAFKILEANRPEGRTVPSELLLNASARRLC